MFTRDSNTRVAEFINGAGVGTQKVLPVAINQTIGIGDWLVITAGLLTQAIAAPGSNNTVSSPGSLVPYAVALAPITTGGTVDQDVDKIPVMVLDDDGVNRMLMRIYAAVAADAEQQDVLIGTSYRLARWRGGAAAALWYMMSVTTAQGDVKLRAFSPQSAKGDDYGLVEVGR